MDNPESMKPKIDLAFRVGAASLYVIVGMVIGIVIAATVVAVRGEQASPSFAAITFGVTAVSALLAAAFPSTALDALAPIANFGWGVMNGSLVPESIHRPDREAGSLNQWLFWAGFTAGCGLLLLWLLT
jgi:hypothetical protein